MIAAIMKEPLWRTVLCWSAVICFFMMPLCIFLVQLYGWTHPGWITPLQYGGPRLDYMAQMQRNVTLLVFGLSGLRTWEQIKNGKPAPPRKEPQ
jgi:hypothetical protein